MKRTGDDAWKHLECWLLIFKFLRFDVDGLDFIILSFFESYVSNIALFYFKVFNSMFESGTSKEVVLRFLFYFFCSLNEKEKKIKKLKKN